VGDLLDDCVRAAVDALLAANGGPVWDRAAFATLRDAVRAELGATTFRVVDLVRQVLLARQSARARLADLPSFAPRESVADVRAQLDALVYRGFVTDTGLDHLADLVRYLRAVDRRLEKLPENPNRDVQRTRDVAAVTADYRDVMAGLPPAAAAGERARHVRWMIEELRVSYFAQQLGTAYPVSEKRIQRALDELA
jgi:ATP-dependent helicase HrpA